MKKLLLSAAAVAALGLAGAASAQTVSERVNINANVASKCGVSAQRTLVTLPTDLTDSRALVRPAVTQEIAAQLNSAQIVAFCNSPRSEVLVERGVLTRVGATGRGLTEGGFAQFVRYNLNTSIDGVSLDSTAGGQASSVGTRFGGHNSLGDSRTHILFEQAASNGPAVAATNGTDERATNWQAVTDRRLASGDYTGWVSIELTPVG